MTAGLDPADNAPTLAAAVAEAAAGGATLLFTPEMTNLIDRDRARSASSVRGEADDPVLAAAREAARAHGLWLHIGSLALVDGDARVNRGFVVDGDGAIRTRYDKLHLFDVDVGGGERWRESAVYRAGDRSVVADTPAGPLGLSICYDLRFPSLYQALSGAGARVLSVPAAFTVPTGEAHWHVLLRARAIEAAAFVVAAAQTGVHQDGRRTYGHSLVVGPWGDVLLDMGAEPGVGIVEIDPVAVDEARARIPVLDHRRPIPPVTRD